jgi:tetratricopeptide (TPR) repeat protein
MDAQGPEKPRPYVEKANTTFPTVVDESNLLSQLYGFKAVPNGMLIDEAGRLQYRKWGGFDIRKSEYHELLEQWTQRPSPEELAAKMSEDKVGGAEHQQAIAHFQEGLALYRQGKVQEALAQWRKGVALEPDNFVIRKQIWAVEHPEKFYEGDVDYGWQREQLEQGL